jgi:hypothetical protein
MPAERQWRALDPPTEQPVTEVLVKPPQPIEVDSVLINPHDLHDQFLARARLAEKQQLVSEREPIVRPCRSGTFSHRSDP